MIEKMVLALSTGWALWMAAPAARCDLHWNIWLKHGSNGHCLSFYVFEINHIFAS